MYLKKLNIGCNVIVESKCFALLFSCNQKFCLILLNLICNIYLALHYLSVIHVQIYKFVSFSEENMADNDRNLKDKRGKDENVEFKYVLSEDENNTVEEDTDQNEIIDLFSATQEVLIPNVEIRKSAALSTASNIKVDATDKIKSCPLRNRSFPSESATSSRKKGKFCEDSVVSTEQENLCDDLTESQEIPLINLFASKTRKRKVLIIH